MSEKSQDQAADNKNRYKDTVNLPATSFAMKANLPQKEPEMIQSWLKNNIYQKMVARNKGNKPFAFPDGPPYANGNIHMGHALNKILKDIVIKYHNMSGQPAVFIPGWDCHGLPIELGVSKNLGAKRSQITEKEFRDHCRSYAMDWINKQREQFKRLGLLADWENPYLTMQPVYEAEEVRQLAKMVETGAFYGGEKPVYWCLPLQTALADTEVEYHNHKSPAVYVKFNLQSGPNSGAEKLGNPKKKTSFVIWTTTPWTLPANLAICVNPEFEYALYELNDEYIVIAKGLKEKMEEDTGLKLLQVGSQTWKGQELEGIKTRHPFIERESGIILGTHVTLDAGTGCVHTAPGHGQDDYIVGSRYGLPVYSPVDAAGKFTKEVPFLEGMQVFEANPKVIETLRSSGHLIAHKEIEHSYPHCWRTKTPLIFRATSQWFLSMSDGKFNLRQKSLDAIKTVRWVPKWGENRITAMVENRPDWCLSRQRIWGVPIPVFFCTKCDEPMVSAEAMNRVADKMEQEGGMEAYHKYEASEFTKGMKCAKCGCTEFKKCKDILDVWFDSGVCHASVQMRREGLTSPADLYLEGSDQHRGWFQTSLLTSVATTGQAPFKTVLTHGFVNDIQGRKMSKSLGNVIDPIEVMKTSGAEILRLWTAYEDYGQDVTCGKESFERLSETYRRMRNTMRFLLGNMNDFDPTKDAIAFSEMLDLDQWALMRLNVLIETCTSAFENYEFHKIYHGLNNFVTVDLSAVYLDILKDRLYTWKKTGKGRRSAQTVLYYLTKTMCGLMAPILSFLAEETYACLPGSKVESIFLTDFPKVNPQWKRDGLFEKFEVLLNFRGEAQKVLENLRREKVIGSSLEASLVLQAQGKELQVLKEFEAQLPTLMIVSQVRLSEGPTEVKALKADGEKCVRCWNYSLENNKSAQFPEVCPKCVEALS